MGRPLGCGGVCGVGWGGMGGVGWGGVRWGGMGWDWVGWAGERMGPTPPPQPSGSFLRSWLNQWRKCLRWRQRLAGPGQKPNPPASRRKVINVTVQFATHYLHARALASSLEVNRHWGGWGGWWEILKYRLLAAGPGKSRQVYACLGKSSLTSASPQ